MKNSAVINSETKVDEDQRATTQEQIEAKAKAKAKAERIAKRNELIAGGFVIFLLLLYIANYVADKLING